MGSFKLKLVTYFVMLALLPLAAAFAGFDSLATRSETNRVDARLEAGLRAALNAYGDRLTDAAHAAARAAAEPALQRAMRAGDRDAIAQAIGAAPRIVVHTRSGQTVGSVAGPTALETVDVLDRGRPLGTVSVAVPLNSALLAYLRLRTGLNAEDELVFLRRDRIVRGHKTLLGRSLVSPAGRAGGATVAGKRFRVLRAADLREPRGANFAVLTPQHRIDAAVSRIEYRLLATLIGLLILIGFVAYGLSRTIVRSLSRLADAAREIARGELQERVPVRGRDEFAKLAEAFNDMAAQLEGRLSELDAERVRLRDSTARIGQALAFTHDIDRLLVVLAETVVEATGADGAVVLGSGGELARAGEPDTGSERLELPLTAGRQSFGRLVVRGSHFTAEAREVTVSLVGQAVIALENARLHSIVERQASIDGLTDVSNRRAGELALHSELSRVERLGGELALIVSDLDDFKNVNDRYGHPTGDAVLREFAATLTETVRDFDIVSRWGGEEFTLILPGTDAVGGARVAERARAAFAERLLLAADGSRIGVTASFGVASFPDHAGEEGLVAAADAALYEAKRTGKNRVVMAEKPGLPAR